MRGKFGVSFPSLFHIFGKMHQATGIEITPEHDSKILILHVMDIVAKQLYFISDFCPEGI